MKNAYYAEISELGANLLILLEKLFFFQAKN